MHNMRCVCARAASANSTAGDDLEFMRPKRLEKLLRKAGVEPALEQVRYKNHPICAQCMDTQSDHIFNPWNIKLQHLCACGTDRGLTRVSLRCRQRRGLWRCWSTGTRHCSCSTSSRRQQQRRARKRRRQTLDVPDGQAIPVLQCWLVLLFDRCAAVFLAVC